MRDVDIVRYGASASSSSTNEILLRIHTELRRAVGGDSTWVMHSHEHEYTFSELPGDASEIQTTVAKALNARLESKQQEAEVLKVADIGPNDWFTSRYRVDILIRAARDPLTTPKKRARTEVPGLPASPPWAPKQRKLLDMVYDVQPPPDVLAAAQKRLTDVYVEAYNAVDYVCDEVFYMEFGGPGLYDDAIRKLKVEGDPKEVVYEKLAEDITRRSTPGAAAVTAENVETHIQLELRWDGYWYLDDFFYRSARSGRLPPWHDQASNILERITTLCGRVRLQDAASKDYFLIQLYKWLKLNRGRSESERKVPFFDVRTSYYAAYGFQRVQGFCRIGGYHKSLDLIRQDLSEKVEAAWRKDGGKHTLQYEEDVGTLLNHTAMQQWLDAWEARKSGPVPAFALRSEE